VKPGERHKYQTKFLGQEQKMVENPDQSTVGLEVAPYIYPGCALLDCTKTNIFDKLI
jgi:hypothetical protein